MAYTKVNLQTNDVIVKTALDHMEQGIADAAVATDVNAALATKANIANPTFTGTVGGLTKGMVGLGNVDNTADANKPVSTAMQTALNNKAPLDSPAFTGTPTLNGQPLSQQTSGYTVALSYDETNGIVSTGSVSYDLSYDTSTGIITAS
jgi:hypothetical protein